MGYLTESAIANVLDMPVTLPATELQMGDWIIVSTVKVIEPQQLTFRWLDLQILSASVDIDDISAANLIFGNLGLVYVALRRDYTSGSPGETGALDVLTADELELVSRDTSDILTFVTPGNYSWIIANNCQPSSSSTISTSVSIDFRVAVTGQARLELDNS